MKKYVVYVVLFLLYLVEIGYFQSTDYVAGEFIVQLDKSIDVKTFCDKHSLYRGAVTSLQAIQQLCKTMNLWLLSFDHQRVEKSDFLVNLREDNEIVIAQYNHTNIVKRVTTPNDTRYGDMWNMNNIGQTGGNVDRKQICK